MQDATLAELLEQYSPAEIELELDALECERDLALFFQRAWPSFDPNPYAHNWHIDCIADHLMAVTDGHIRKLLINVPFRSSKTTLVSVAWPSWVWAQRRRGPISGPQVSFLCLSYASHLSERNSLTARRLISSKWYQDRWGARVQVAKDKDSLREFDTTAGGQRIAAGFDGATLGFGGAVRIIDDPHKVQEVESDLVRENVLRTYDEALASRVTDFATSAEVIIMQRLDERDLSGHVLERGGFVHLCLPLEYEPARHCITVIGDHIWEDPRGIDPATGERWAGLNDDGSVEPGSPMAAADGAILDPVRFPPEEVVKLKEQLGPFAVAGQLQQSPAPRGGGLVQREWWRLWPHEQFPAFGTVLVSADTAFTEKEENDATGVSVWGCFPSDDGMPLFMLVDAFEERLELPQLVRRLGDVCKKRKADVLLIEGKASGLSTAQEIRRQYGDRAWRTLISTPKGDKIARLKSVQPMFSGKVEADARTGRDVWRGGVIFAPDKEWAQFAIDACASFPRTAHKDVVDSISQALAWFRVNGVALTRDEYDAERLEAETYRKPPRPLYDV